MRKKRHSNRVSIGNARIKRKSKKRMQHKGIRSAIGKFLGKRKAKETNVQSNGKKRIRITIED